MNIRFTSELFRRLQNPSLSSGITQDEFSKGLESGKYTQTKPFSTYSDELKIDNERGGVFVWSCRLSKYFLIGKCTANS